MTLRLDSQLHLLVCRPGTRLLFLLPRLAFLLFITPVKLRSERDGTSESKRAYRRMDGFEMYCTPCPFWMRFRD
jgi:hypothetical protein